MYHEDIKELTKDNTYFREVLYTGPHSQLVVMSLKVNEDIGKETHPNIDQLFFIVEGDGEATVGQETFGIDEHDVVYVPAGTEHNVRNVGKKELKLYTIYSPPAHPDGTTHETKADAQNEH